SHSAQLPRSNQSPPHFSPAAQPKPPAQTSSTQPGPLPLSRGPVSPARSHGFSFLPGLSFPLRPSVRPPLLSACSALRDAPSLRGPLNHSAQRVALPAALQPGPTRLLHPLARVAAQPCSLTAMARLSSPTSVYLAQTTSRIPAVIIGPRQSWTRTPRPAPPF